MFERLKKMILDPQPGWAAAAAETGALKDIFVPYVAILALAPGLGALVRPLMDRAGFVPSYLLSTILGSYILTLALLLGFGRGVKALAVAFGSRAELLPAMRLAAYSATPWLVAGLFAG